MGGAERRAAASRNAVGKSGEKAIPQTANSKLLKKLLHFQNVSESKVAPPAKDGEHSGEAADEMRALDAAGSHAARPKGRGGVADSWHGPVVRDESGRRHAEPLGRVCIAALDRALTPRRGLHRTPRAPGRHGDLREPPPPRRALRLCAVGRHAHRCARARFGRRASLSPSRARRRCARELL